MGKIDNPKSTENQCKPKGDKRIGATLVEPIQYLKKDRIHCSLPTELFGVARRPRQRNAHSPRK